MFAPGGFTRDTTDARWSTKRQLALVVLGFVCFVFVLFVCFPIVFLISTCVDYLMNISVHRLYVNELSDFEDYV